MGRRALFLDWGGTLAMTRDNRTVVDASGNPVLLPKVAETLAPVRADYGACFIVSNQARIGRGEIAEAEVLRRGAWLDARLGTVFTDWRLCPHDDADGCACRKPRPGMFLELASAHAGRGTSSAGEVRPGRSAVMARGPSARADGPRCLRSPGLAPPS
jgi:HAD superfamily hydrolase (TIGR01662 family)